MSQIDDLPPLRDVIREFELDARKSLGQNFLLDLNLTTRIAKTAGDLANHTIVEVGPGPGGLTRAILALGAENVVAIEKDPRCLPALKQIQQHYPDRLQVIEADALRMDLREISNGRQVKIIANLPYNIGTQLLLNWMTEPQWPPQWSSLTLMFQREVVERIVAAPGEKHYGRLGVLCGWRAHANLMFDVGPKAFVPPPKVTSAIVHLTPRAAPLPCSVKDLERVTAAGFGQRRKMLRASLKALSPNIIEILESLGIPPTARAEEIPVEGFIALARALSSTKP